jgi:hypothetical protein
MKWRSALLVATALLAISFAAPLYAAEGGGQLDDCIFLGIGNVTARAGEDIMVPIRISNTTGWGIMAFEGQICWCDLPVGLIQFEGCEEGEVFINSGWVMGGCGLCESNCVNFAAAHFEPLVGEGILFYLKFHVSANAKPCMCCELTWDFMHLYDPEDPLNVCLSGGEVCIEHCDIYGTVKAWFCEYDCGRMYHYFPLPDARIHLSQCGEAVATTYTNDHGRFEFECLWPHYDPQLKGDPCCPYCIDIDYCRAPDRAINAFDAALILMYLVCYDDLNCCYFYNCGDDIYPQQIAADVNCTGVITAYDASLILQYIVHILPAFPCPDPWVWINLDCDWCTMSCPGYFDIIGIYKGDVSGFCYDGQGDALTATAKMKVGIPQHRDGFVDIPVLVEGATDVYSVQFDVDYNHAAFTFDSVRPAGLTNGFISSYNEADGVVKVAMAGTESFDGNGRVAVVRFVKNDRIVPVDSPRITLANAFLNETEPMIEGRSYDSAAVGFALGPVSPNPTNMGTVISFSAPKASHVSLSIFNVNGQLIRTVHDSQVAAGTHSVAWDGNDSNGARVARGVYFCRMNVDEFSATQKVVLLQ